MKNTKQIAERAAADSAYVHDVTVNASKTLDSVLAEIVRTEQVQENGVTVTRPVYNREHTWNITIASGYAATISSRYGRIRCNFHLKGAGTAKSKIYISKSVVTQTGLGDSILSFYGESMARRIEVSFENLEFMPVGAVAGTTFVSSSATNFTTEAHLIKIYFARKATLYKVTSFLENGIISNVDFRTCDGIRVNECEFTNNNGVMSGNRTGGIMMVRGIMNDVIISNSTFTKYGNDEMLWVAGNPVPEPSLSDGVPDAEKELSVRRNIRITNNTFHYRRPTVSADSSTLRPSNTMDVMITFDSFKNCYWENVLFAYNTILAEDLVRRIVWVQNTQNSREYKNFRFFGNKIRHAYTYTSADGWAYDFWMSGDGSVQPQEPIEIAGNEIEMAETIGPSNIGHIGIFQSGLSLNVHDNLIDGTDFKVENPYSYQSTGILPFSIENYAATLEFVNNKCYNTGSFGYIRNSTDNAAVTVRIRGNYVEGGSRIAFSGAPETDLRVENNYFRSTSYELMLQGAPPTGAIWASENVWETIKPTPTSSSGVKIFANYTTGATWDLSRITFIDNVVTGERTLGTLTFPTAVTTVIAGNTTN